ncbi:MAG: ribosome-associated translation inhibitor RaiA [Candidatus Bipolaricaulota bacterium]|nr:ribosome-associated translation inhibitor RaiA [Candidatus Bipolaricaulota bacterium]MDW8126266.1 ribosome-associated translation inhibitor RaiA [Candidatus Bipolaricaulota bacterium]
MDLHIVERYQVGSNSIRQYVEKKVGVLSRYFDRITRMDVVLETEGAVNRVQIMARLVNKKVIKAVAETNDMLTSLDEAVDKMQRQLVQFKEKLRVVRKAGDPEVEPRPAVKRLAVEEVEDYVRKPISVEEAVEELEGSGREFLVFFDRETEEPAVLYKKRGGGYGLIKPRR